MPGYLNDRPCASLGTLAVALLAGFSGCGAPQLRVEDAVLAPNDKATLRAHAEHSVAGFLRGGEPGLKVHFLLDGQEVGHAKTDFDGKAELKCRVPRETPRVVEAVTALAGKRAQARGNVYVWRKDRPIVLVDVDATISETDYLELTFAPADHSSRPIKNAAETLHELSNDFYIAYYTARPRTLLDKTREWIAEHQFPPGPVLASTGSNDVIWQAAFKHKLIADLRHRWPNLLIGIGDNTNDTGPFDDHGLLAVVVHDGLFAPHGSRMINLEGWEAVREFFQANRQTLASTAKLQDAIKRNTLVAGRVALVRSRANADREVRASAAEQRAGAGPDYPLIQSRRRQRRPRRRPGLRSRPV